MLITDLPFMTRSQWVRLEVSVRILLVLLRYSYSVDTELEMLGEEGFLMHFDDADLVSTVLFSAF